MLSTSRPFPRTRFLDNFLFADQPSLKVRVVDFRTPQDGPFSMEIARKHCFEHWITTCKVITG